MTEQHEWKLDLARRGYYCDVEGCTTTLLLDDAIPRLNEYETLKKATDALSAEDANMCASIIYAYAGDMIHAGKVQAYADILEGK